MDSFAIPFSLLDFRGSDVRLESGIVLELSRQAVPYPAIAWASTTVQAYKWGAQQHINVLELTAFLICLRLCTRELGLCSARFFHVLYSRVCCCVLAKGRSSSKLLNRLLRRITCLLLFSDAYLLPLWTISGWNFADAPSRLFTPTVLRDDG